MTRLARGAWTHRPALGLPLRSGGLGRLGKTGCQQSGGCNSSYLLVLYRHGHQRLLCHDRCAHSERIHTCIHTCVHTCIHDQMGCGMHPVHERVPLPQAKPCYTMLRHAKPRQAAPRYAKRRHATPCHATAPCDVTRQQVSPCPLLTCLVLCVLCRSQRSRCTCSGASLLARQRARASRSTLPKLAIRRWSSLTLMLTRGRTLTLTLMLTLV